LIWLRIGSSGGLLWTRKWSFGFYKRLENSRVAAQLAASQEGLSSLSKFIITSPIWPLSFGLDLSEVLLNLVPHHLSKKLNKSLCSSGVQEIRLQIIYLEKVSHQCLESHNLSFITIFVKKKKCKKFVHVGRKSYYMRKVKITTLYRSGGTWVRHWRSIGRPRCVLSIEIEKWINKYDFSAAINKVVEYEKDRRKLLYRCAGGLEESHRCSKPKVGGS
jgi:hypothetical protein